MWHNSARRWLVAEVDVMEPLYRGDTLACICAFTEVLVARDGVAHDHQCPCHALLVALHAMPMHHEIASSTAKAWGL